MKKDYKDYTAFVEYLAYHISELMVNYYLKHPAAGLEKYFWQIQQWLDAPHQKNKPLVLEGPVGSGKKTLLVKWKEYHQTKHKDDIVLIHFASAGGSYGNHFFAIYKTLIKLRELMNISQKVQLQEQKLRKYLAYWLQVCDRSIEAQTINNTEVHYQKIILIFQGVNYFTDRESGKEGNISFWLPQTFPKGIKVIISADSDSFSMRHFRQQKCKIVMLNSQHNSIRYVIDTHQKQAGLLNSSLKGKLFQILNSKLQRIKDCLFYNSLLSVFSPSVESSLTSQFVNMKISLLNWKALSSVQNTSQLFKFALEFWSKHLTTNQKCFNNLMMLFVTTQKGLLMDQILGICQCSIGQVKKVIGVFSLFVIKYKDLYMIKNDTFKTAICERSHSNIMQTHQAIAEVMYKTPNSVRKLQEQTYHLFNCKSYFKLKEIISDVQNFLLLFNRFNKYDLCRYWQCLQSKTFDPVTQYNKAIEGFEMHYHPSAQDLFRIIVQISRFLKEFSDFQTSQTPDFRHPSVVGTKKDLQDICMYDQLKTLDLCQTFQQTQQKKSNDTDIEMTRNKFIHEKVIKMKERLFDLHKSKATYKRQDISKEKQMQQKKDSQNNGKKKNAKDYKKWDQENYQSSTGQITKANVDVPSNRVRFREYFEQIVHQFLQKHHLFVDKEDQDQKQRKEEAGQKVNRKIDFQKLSQQQFYQQEKQPKNYYYKRWIWMQFPWVCISLKQDYSGKLIKCFTSPTQYMSVKEQSQFTRQSLNIALEAKMRKQLVLKDRSSQKKLSFSRDEHTTKVNKFRKTKSRKRNSQEPTLFFDSMMLTQEKLVKMLPKDPKAKEKLQSTFLTQERIKEATSSDQKKGRIVLRSEDQKKQSSLPEIKLIIDTQIKKEIKFLEDNNLTMRKKIDALSNSNLALSKKLQELKTIEMNELMQQKNIRRLDQVQTQIKQLKEKTQKIQINYCYSLLEKQRLNNLIRICKQNKTQNEESLRPLTFQAANFKKMIKWQIQQIKQTKQAIHNNRKEQQIQMKKAQLQNRLRNQQKNQIERTIYQHSIFQKQLKMQDEALNVISNKQKNQNQNKNDKDTKISLQNQRQKKIQDLAQLKDKLHSFSRIISCKEDEFQTDPDFIRFKQQVQKQRQFNNLISIRKQRIGQLNEQIQQRKDYLGILTKATGDQPIRQLLVINEDRVDDKDKLSNQTKIIYQLQKQLQKLTEIRLSCQGSINYLRSKFKIEKDPNDHLAIFRLSHARLSQLLLKHGDKKSEILEGRLNKPLPRLDLEYFNNTSYKQL